MTNRRQWTLDITKVQYGYNYQFHGTEIGAGFEPTRAQLASTLAKLISHYFPE